MKGTTDLLTENYDYELPEALIASRPVYPRDSAKLLVYDRKTDTVTHTTFSHFLEYLPKECDIFLNDTRVIKARIFGHKERIGDQGGGKVELLFNKSLDAYRSLVLIRGKVTAGMKLLFNIVRRNSGNFERTGLNRFPGGKAHHATLLHTYGGYDDRVFLLYQVNCGGVKMIVMRVGDQD